MHEYFWEMIVQHYTQNTAVLVWNAGIYQNDETHYSTNSFYVRSSGPGDCQRLLCLSLALILYYSIFSLWEGVKFKRVMRTWLPTVCVFEECIMILLNIVDVDPHGKSLLAFLNEYWYMKLNVTLFQTWPDFYLLFLVWLIELVYECDRKICWLSVWQE